MLMVYQQINWNTIYKMPTVEDPSSEQNFIAHWMSDSSRAGVLLDPSFTSLKINRESLLSGPENITAFPVEVLHLSDSCSVSDDSLREEESGSTCTLQQCTSETSLPAAAYNTETSKTDFVHGEVDGQNKSDHSDPLLQKLKQLKELQQQKQEQLKKQQMEQLQRLMEEQQKLLSMVSGQTAVLGCTLMAESQKLRPGHSAGLTTLCQLPSPGYQNTFEDRAYAPIVSPHTQDCDFLQKLNNKECTSSLKNSLSGVSACEKQGKNMWCPEQKMEILMESEDHHIDPLCAERADLSENSSREKQLWTNTEERPIKAAIQEKKQTFEEYLEEQIQLEEQRLGQNQKLQETNGSAIQKPVIKRPFLKRGEGLTRFTNAKSKITKLGESTPKCQQRASDDRNVIKVDRSQIQKKTMPPSKERVSENPFAPCKKHNHPDKAKHCPIQKNLVLRNHNGKSIYPLETRIQPGKNHDGQMRDFPSEINNKIENKENVVEFAKSNTGKIGNKSPSAEKPQLSHELASAVSNSKCPIGHPVKDPELSFEVSFQNKLENWEKEKEKENLELDEFLFLEQAADEISFSSNSSFVQRILDQDQQTLKGRRMSSTPIKAKQQQVKALAVELINKKNKKADCMTQGNISDRAVMHTVSNSGTAFRMKDPLNKTDSVIFSASSMTAAPVLKSNQWIVNEDKGEGNGGTTTDSESEFETTLKHENEDAKISFMSHRESDPEFFDYGRSVTDMSKESKNGDADLGLSDKDCSALSKQKIRKAPDYQRSMSCISRSKFEFDDERTWSDLDENYVNSDLPEKYTKIPLQMDFSTKNDTTVPDKAIKRKVATKRGDEMSKESAVDSDSNGPPVSNLMMKLFPSLKPKQKAGCHSEHEIKSNVEQEPGGSTVPSQVLRERLAELETEIERFRAENTTLTKLREEREHALANIRKEIADFQQQKAQELAEIEEYKKKEMKKLQKERKVFEKYTTEARAIPDKKERDEIQALKQQIAELQEDLKRKEAKWSTTHRRLKDQIEALVNENMELKEEVRIMERFRLEAWKKVEAAGSKRKIENSGMTLKRAESHLPNRGPTSQTASLLLPVQKCSKINGKSYSQAKGKLSRIPASAPPNDRSNSETMTALEDSSRTFMDTSPNEAHVSLPSGPAYTDSEEIERETAYPDGKVEKVLKNGSHLIFFPNGTWKKVGSDGKTITITFFNGDVKQVMPDQTVIYYYADAKTTHTTYSDGLEVLHFSNGQIEKHYPDGKKEITFPDQTIKNLFTDGQEESIFPDGTILRIQRDGSKTIEFNNGQRELHTSQFKRREYPDGTVKTVYTNGQQETKYVSGRVRVKDKDGNIIMDTKL
ncbi:centrosomal P4.1-associated protein isoform X2 [Mycteria americana]|uniref:centrosomal P4.1-associated protein isoform X2 n=1 Tax=Mycteria americana TaxID=33587 RepID=UPI003F582D8B